jgi:hypothetical protein
VLWVGAATLALGFAGWAYLARERLGAAGLGLAVLRATALLAIVALLVNVAYRRSAGDLPTTVLLDASLSMSANRLPWAAILDSAVVRAGREGRVLRFGTAVSPLDSGAPDAGRSRVRDGLRAAAAWGGRVLVLTDGELDDADALPAAVRGVAEFVVLPRRVTPGLALTDVTVPSLVVAGDSIPVAMELATWGGLPDSAATVTVRVGERWLLQRTIPVPPGAGRGRRTVAVPAGLLPSGTHVLSVSVTAAGDADRRDDTRQRVVEVAALPTAVLVADPPDWESRFLARELADIVPGGLQAFGHLGGNRWVDLRTQAVVAASRVASVRRAAAVVFARGGTVGAPQPRRVWRWTGGSGGLTGDWYVTDDLAASDLVPRLAGIAWDSLPPLGGVQAVELPGYAPVLTARLGRRGAQRVVLATRDSAGRRELVSTAAGFWRWALRGGADREAFRTLLAAGVEWLLQGVNVRADAPVVVQATVPRGVPVPVRWVAGATSVPDSVPMVFVGADTTVVQAVRFGDDRTGAVALPPGVYTWRADGLAGASGITVVEAYSPEFVPRPVVVPDRTPATAAGAVPGGLREVWWAFGIVAALFIVEWAWRLRRGLP